MALPTRAIRVDFAETPAKEVKFTLYSTLIGGGGQVLRDKKFPYTLTKEGVIKGTEDNLITLTVHPTGTVRYDYEIPSRANQSKGHFYIELDDASTINLSELITGGVLATDTLIAWINENVPTIPAGGETTDVLMGNGAGGAAWIALTADTIAEGAANLFLTPTERTKLSNTSGNNSGDNAVNTLYSGLDAAKANKAGDVFTGAVGLINGAAATPAIYGANFTDTGILFGETALEPSPYAAITVDGVSNVSFHPTTHASDTAGVFQATGFLKVQGTIQPSNGLKAGAVFNIASLEANQTGNGGQAAVFVRLGGYGGVGTRETYGLKIQNESQSSLPVIGISASTDGGTVGDAGIGTTPGLNIGAEFWAKDSLTGSVGSWSSSTGSTNADPVHFGSISQARNSAINVGAYISLHDVPTTYVLPSVAASAALIVDNADQNAIILDLRDNGTSVFKVDNGGATTFAGSSFSGLTAAMVGLGSVQNYGVASQAEAVAGSANDKYMTPLRTAEAIAIFVDSAPATLDTLNELAAALGDDPNFATTVTNSIAAKFTLPSLTSGSLLFSNGSTIAQDNANLFWDDTNNRLGIGTNAPDTPLHVYGTANGTAQAVFERDSANSSGFVLSLRKDRAGGFLSLNDTLGQISFTGSNGAGAFVTSAYIRSIVDNISTPASPQAKIVFSCGGASPVDVLTLNSNNTAAFAGAVQMAEMTAPAAPAANGVILYAVDNGAGKTQLMALFSSGAAQQLAIQP
jgi:hypothetical protein